MRFVRFLVFLLLFVVSACTQQSPNLSAMGSPPDYRALSKYQETATRDEIQNSLLPAYTFDDGWIEYLNLEDKAMQVLVQEGSKKTLSLSLAKDSDSKKEAPKYWRKNPLIGASQQQALAGLRILLDPGHLGGEWARMEGRWFRPEGQSPIAEGDLTLLVAKKLRKRLESLGASVYLTRESSDPVTILRPKHLEILADELMKRDADLNISSPESFASLSREEQRRRLSELLFYRVAEIRARAAWVNEVLRPDVSICLHFNAGNWGDPESPKPALSNHLHVLIPGAVESEEWALDDLRFEMTRRMLDGTHAVELQLGLAIANGLAQSTGLAPAIVPGGSVKKIGDNPYLWSRNLLANRLYQNPTIFIEAYVMNHPETMARLAMGDYEGRKKIGEKEFSSLFEDYSEGVAQGIAAYFSALASDTTH